MDTDHVFITHDISLHIWENNISPRVAILWNQNLWFKKCIGSLTCTLVFGFTAGALFTRHETFFTVI